MKQTFVVEIETLGNQSALRDFQIMAVFKNGFDEFFGGNVRPLSAKETNVEQSSGTPDFSSKKALDLLKQAAQSLREYCLSSGGPYRDSLGEKIEEYLKGIQ